MRRLDAAPSFSASQKETTPHPDSRDCEHKGIVKMHNTKGFSRA